MARGTAFALAGWLAAVFGAAQAAALSVQPSELPFLDRNVNLRVSGTLEVLGIEAGLPAGAVVTEGSVAAGADVILLQASVDGVSTTGLSSLLLSIVRLVPGTSLLETVPPSAVGFLAGPGRDVDPLIDETNGLAHAGFPTPLGAADGASDVFFFAYDELRVGDQIGLFAVGENVGSRIGISRGFARIVPEPGTGMLLAMALAALAVGRRAPS